MNDSKEKEQYGKLLRVIMRDDGIIRDPEYSLSRQKIHLACLIGIWGTQDRTPQQNLARMLDWLDQATETDVEWLFDPHGEPR